MLINFVSFVYFFCILRIYVYVMCVKSEAKAKAVYYI